MILKVKSILEQKSCRGMMDHKIKEKSKNRIGTTGKSIQHDFFGIIALSYHQNQRF